MYIHKLSIQNTYKGLNMTYTRCNIFFVADRSVFIKKETVCIDVYESYVFIC